MSKLAIVLCAVGFYVSQVIANSSTLPPLPPENAITRRMDEALKEIEKISKETYKRVLGVDPQNLIEKTAVDVQYREKLAAHLRVVKFHVEQIVSSGRRGNFNERRCRRPFNKYKSLGNGYVLAPIQEMSWEALRNVSTKYGRLLRVTKQTIEKIQLAKAQGLESKSNPEDYYRAIAMSDFDYFTTSTDDFIQFLEDTVTGKTIQEKMHPLWVTFVDSGPEIIAKTYNCVFFPI